MPTITLDLEVSFNLMHALAEYGHGLVVQVAHVPDVTIAEMRPNHPSYEFQTVALVSYRDAEQKVCAYMPTPKIQLAHAEAMKEQKS